MTRSGLLLASVAILTAGVVDAAAQRSPDVSSSASADDRSGSVPVYRLAPDDKLKITVYGEDDLSGPYMVGSDGNLSFPLIGMVPVRGLTLAQLQARLVASLGAKYLNNPRVSVDMVEYRPFYILGEVNKAGQYPYRVGMTVNAAVATAGGFTYRANHKRIVVQHYGEASDRKYPLTSDLLVAPGDTIRVLERFF